MFSIFCLCTSCCAPFCLHTQNSNPLQLVNEWDGRTSERAKKNNMKEEQAECWICCMCAHRTIWDGGRKCKLTKRKNGNFYSISVALLIANWMEWAKNFNARFFQYCRRITEFAVFQLPRVHAVIITMLLYFILYTVISPVWGASKTPKWPTDALDVGGGWLLSGIRFFILLFSIRTHKISNKNAMRCAPRWGEEQHVGHTKKFYISTERGIEEILITFILWRFDRTPQTLTIFFGDKKPKIRDFDIERAQKGSLVRRKSLGRGERSRKERWVWASGGSSHFDHQTTNSEPKRRGGEAVKKEVEGKKSFSHFASFFLAVHIISISTGPRPDTSSQCVFIDFDSDFLPDWLACTAGCCRRKPISYNIVLSSAVFYVMRKIKSK